MQFTKTLVKSKPRRALILAAAALLTVAAATFTVVRLASADTYDQQIANIQNQSSQVRSQINSLKSQARSYQDMISLLQGQIDAVQAQINANQAQQDELQRQINAAQVELEHQRLVLSENIKSMYTSSEMTTIEMLATSKSLSDFIDKDTYRNAVQRQIQETMTKIQKLQNELNTKKTEVERLLAEQQAQRATLDGSRQEQATLLAMNQGQQSEFNSQLAANNAQITNLRRQQAAAYAAADGGSTSPSGGSITYKNRVNYGFSFCNGYRYCGSGFDDFNRDTLYRWGLEWTRECVHYAADRIERDGHRIPAAYFSGRGNANEWIGTVTSGGRGGPIGHLTGDPQRGDVAYMPIGSVGHVGIVEHNYGDGWVKISQMNFPYGGNYSEMDLKITSGVRFLRINS